MLFDLTFLVRVSALLLPGALFMVLNTARAAVPAASEEVRAGLEKLSRRRIFFGHQSVGANLLEGVRLLTPASGSPAPHLLEVKDATATLAPGTLAHAMVGQNERPESKLAHFEQLMDGGLAKQVDVAFFKLCYIDFTGATNASALFAKYRATMDGLKARHPGVTFVHVTVPLTTVQRGARAWLKEMLGHSVWGTRENAAREAFNALVRQTYAGKEPVFDLARLESTRPDGTRETYALYGRTYPALVPSYSDDGSHLNAAGQVHVASAFVSFLASLPEAAPAARSAP